MAHFVYNNAYLSINAEDKSAHVESLQVTHSQDLQDDTVMGDTFRNRLPGLQDYQLQVTFHDEFADNDLDEDLFALLGTTFAVAWRPSAAAISVNNPEFQFTGVLGDQQLGGSVGEIGKRTVTIMIASGTVTRDVTP